MLNNDINPMMNMNNPIMGMNPMPGMNNMNNQSNIMYMDTTAQNIKSIIEPYENQIRQLEEIIKQKDFEILVLKQKLSQNNMQSNNLINNNQMNMIAGNINNLTQQINNEIKILIKSQDGNFNLIKCFENDKVSVIKDKIVWKGGLIHDYQIIDQRLSIKDAGIINGSLINIKTNIIAIKFQTNHGIFNVNLDWDCPLKMAIAFYCIKDQGNDIFHRVFVEQKMIFLFNSAILNANDETPIKKIFFENKNVKVIVTETDNLIG